MTFPTIRMLVFAGSLRTGDEKLGRLIDRIHLDEANSASRSTLCGPISRDPLACEGGKPPTSGGENPLTLTTTLTLPPPFFPPERTLRWSLESGEDGRRWRKT